MEKKGRRHKQLQTAVLAAGIVLILFASFQHYLSGDLLTTIATTATVTTTTVYSFQNQHHHNAISEQHGQPGGPFLPSRAAAATGTPPVALDGVLFPGWEVLVLLPPDDNPPHPSVRLSCLFPNGDASPANFSGVVPSSRRATYLCTLPVSARRQRRFQVPRLVPSASPTSPSGPAYPSRGELLRWNSMVYESLTTDDDVIVFAKGVNNRQGVDRPTEDLRCVFSAPAAPAAVRTAVTSSCQEVFRCRHPDDAHLAPLLAAAGGGGTITISLEIGDGGGGAGVGRAVPSLAAYHTRARRAQDRGKGERRSLLCACTMVYNVAKFLSEWVAYHSRVGVDRFLLYDNGSDDELDRVVAQLRRRGYDVTTLLWLWPKTQEAGFSHCAAASLGSCDWMMYLDVDEFAYSPSWSNSSRPSPAMLRSILPPPRTQTGGPGRRLPVGQVAMRCYDFGPSNLTGHPAGGVTQGYTCRRRGEERHKSIVRLEAVDPSLHNVIHHFRLGKGYWGTAAPSPARVVVNHYKYQAWAEFKAKFRRRASAYVSDWTQAVNPRSKDRTPGLGFVAVEPPGWAGRFCEVNDTRLRDLVRGWFGRRVHGSTGDSDYRMEWEADS